VPGRNYGWPLVSLGRDYAGPWQGVFAGRIRAGHRQLGAVDCRRRSRVLRRRPLPGLARQRHRRCDALGEIPNTGHIQRIVFNERGEEIRREMMLTELRQRVREVRQGPDGLIYLLTDEAQGAVLRLEPQ
jgi:aldose sugar dehydrogenase